MSRFPQPSGTRGSLKWIQRAVNANPAVLDAAILPAIGEAQPLSWLSPLAGDDFAEYRDAAFLDRLGLAQLGPALAAFWPRRGPQWDALARSDGGAVLLVEAKAHIDEMCSPGTDAGPDSRARIEAALASVVAAAGAEPRAPWCDAFYQLANRFAHLHFLRTQGVAAWLVLVNFVGDREMKGPATRAEWEAAYRVALHVMGLSTRSPLLRHVVHVYPDVTTSA
jgi:hypothetical protein